MWIIDALRLGDMRGAARNRLDEIDAANAKIDEAVQRERDTISEDLTKELRKPLQQLHDYGPDHDYKGNFV